MPQNVASHPGLHYLEDKNSIQVQKYIVICKSLKVYLYLVYLSVNVTVKPVLSGQSR